MNGPQHYTEAERLIEIAKESTDAPIAVAQLLAEAQIHATLALAAATARQDFGDCGTVTPDHGAWEDVCGVVVRHPGGPTPSAVAVDRNALIAAKAREHLAALQNLPESGPQATQATINALFEAVTAADAAELEERPF